MTRGKLKDRVSKHYTDFKYERYRNSTTLSKFIWELQKSNSTFQIEWDILESKPAYKKGQKFCKLCICEKKWISLLAGKERLNSNNEFVSKCPHKWKFRLGRITDIKNVDLLKHTIQPNYDNGEAVVNPVVVLPRRSKRAKTLNSQYSDTMWTS